VQGGQRPAACALFLPSLGQARIKQWLKMKNPGPAKIINRQLIFGDHWRTSTANTIIEIYHQTL
jgi:hypothetical protein